MSTKKNYQRPFSNSFSRPAHYLHIGKDKDNNLVLQANYLHDFYPRSAIKFLKTAGIPLPAGR